jgi:hypothetical protein
MAAIAIVQAGSLSVDVGRGDPIVPAGTVECGDDDHRSWNRAARSAAWRHHAATSDLDPCQGDADLGGTSDDPQWILDEVMRKAGCSSSVDG